MRFEKINDNIIQVTELVEQTKEVPIEQFKAKLEELENELVPIKNEKEELNSQVREIMLKEDELTNKIESMKEVLGIEDMSTNPDVDTTE